MTEGMDQMLWGELVSSEDEGLVSQDDFRAQVDVESCEDLGVLYTAVVNYIIQYGVMGKVLLWYGLVTYFCVFNSKNSFIYINKYIKLRPSLIYHVVFCNNFIFVQYYILILSLK